MMPMSLMEYLQEYPTPPTWNEKTKHEFWRQFVDGVKQNISEKTFQYFKDKYQFSFDASILTVNEMLIWIKQNSSSFPSGLPELFERFIKINSQYLDYNMPLNKAMCKLDGWFAFETRESGYLNGMINGKNLCHQFQGKITAEFIEALHGACTLNVKDTIFDKKDDDHSKALQEKPGQFRNDNNSAFGIKMTGVDSNISEAGLKEFLNTLSLGERGFGLIFENKNGMGSFSLRGKKEGDGFEITFMGESLNANYEEFIKALEGIFMPSPVLTNFQDVVELLTPGSKKYDLFHSLGWVCEIGSLKYKDGYVRQRVQREIDKYYQKLDVIDKDKLLESNEKLEKKVRATVEFVQILERLHPFLDGNCRTLIMLLLPKLLNDLGLGNIYIFDNPNRFDSYGVDELIDETVNALIHAQHITKGILDPLTTSVKTQNQLQVASALEKKYFNDCYASYDFTMDRDQRDQNTPPNFLNPFKKMKSDSSNLTKTLFNFEKPLLEVNTQFLILIKHFEPIREWLKNGTLSTDELRQMLLSSKIIDQPLVNFMNQEILNELIERKILKLNDFIEFFIKKKDPFYLLSFLMKTKRFEIFDALLTEQSQTKDLFSIQDFLNQPIKKGLNRGLTLVSYLLIKEQFEVLNKLLNAGFITPDNLYSAQVPLSENGKDKIDVNGLWYSVEREQYEFFFNAIKKFQKNQEVITDYLTESPQDGPQKGSSIIFLLLLENKIHWIEKLINEGFFSFSLLADLKITVDDVQSNSIFLLIFLQHPDVLNKMVQKGLITKAHLVEPSEGLGAAHAMALLSKNYAEKTRSETNDIILKLFYENALIDLNAPLSTSPNLVYELAKNNRLGFLKMLLNEKQLKTQHLEAQNETGINVIMCLAANKQTVFLRELFSNGLLTKQQVSAMTKKGVSFVWCLANQNETLFLEELLDADLVTSEGLKVSPRHHQNAIACLIHHKAFQLILKLLEKKLIGIDDVMASFSLTQPLLAEKFKILFSRLEHNHINSNQFLMDLEKRESEQNEPMVSNLKGAFFDPATPIKSSTDEGPSVDDNPPKKSH